MKGVFSRREVPHVLRPYQVVVHVKYSLYRILTFETALYNKEVIIEAKSAKTDWIRAEPNCSSKKEKV